MTLAKQLLLVLTISLLLSYQTGCNFITHRTLSNGAVLDSTNDDPEPNYNISLDYDYQDFASYIFMGNRIENFTAYFNTFFKANEDFEEALAEFKTSLISFYNRRLDSLGVTPVVTGGMKDKMDKAIERASKIIQFHKNSKFIDNAVLLIGKAYYYEGDYFNAERKFNEFLSKLSSSDLADEAILFLGQTKVKLGKNEEAVTIFKNLVNNSDDNEIRSLAAGELGIAEYNRGSYSEAVNYFKAAIDFSKTKDRKAESQFILAKVLSTYKPELAANEYKKVMDYSSDFDMTFFARLNSAKGLNYNKDYSNATELLTDIRKKYRDVPEYTQLVDLEIANNLYGQKKLKEAKDKFFEVIIKYPNTVASSDAYYYLAKHEEDVNKNYVNALVNYKKAIEENPSSDFQRESAGKVTTFEKYFTLVGDIKDTIGAEIPTANAELEEFRRRYNDEKGIEQTLENGIEGPRVPKDNDGDQTGEGKGRPGGNKVFLKVHRDSTEDVKEPPPLLEQPMSSPRNNKGKNNTKDNSENPEGSDTSDSNGNDSLSSFQNDSLKAINDSLEARVKEDKVFNAYYELAELFLYNLESNDSAEYYLKLLLTKYPESEKQAKVLYTLGTFYKNTNRKSEADETLGKIISNYPNTIYANESKKIMGIKVSDSDILQDPVDEIFKQAMMLINESKYAFSIAKLQEVEQNHPDDTLVAKALYGIGWIYENKLAGSDSSSINYKDSSIVYYKRLREKFPQTEYALKITPVLDYLASLEVGDTTSAPSPTDTTGISPKDTTSIEAGTDSGIEKEKKEQNPEEVIVDPNNSGEENKLSQDEIDRLLKESETENPSDK